MPTFPDSRPADPRPSGSRPDAAHERERARTARKAEIAALFDTAAENHYDRVHGGFHEQVGARLVALAAPRPGDRVLDLGCGRGAVLFPAVAAVGPDGYAVGIDLSPRMVHATAEDARRLGLRNVSVRVDDAESPGFPAGSFEAVLSSLVLMFTPDPAAAVRAALRLLTPGGVFAATSFGAEIDPRWREAFAALLAFADPPGAPDVSGGSADGPPLEGLLTEAGFADVRTVEEPAYSEYADAQAWWRSLWGGRQRPALERIPERRRSEALAAAAALLPPAPLTRATLVRYTLARRP